jgi:DNA-directed RNA polymerase specialized sigma24 family protein
LLSVSIGRHETGKASVQGRSLPPQAFARVGTGTSRAALDGEPGLGAAAGSHVLTIGGTHDYNGRQTMADLLLAIQAELTRFGIRGRPLSDCERQTLEAEALKRLDGEAARVGQRGKPTGPLGVRRAVRRLVLDRAKQAAGPPAPTEKWLKVIHRSLQRLSRIGDQDRDDLVQCALRRLYENYLTRKTERPFPQAYIRRVAASVVTDAGRRVSRRRRDTFRQWPIALPAKTHVIRERHPLTTNELLAQVAAPTEDPAELLDRDRAVERVLQVLAPCSRAVAEAACRYDMNYAAITEYLEATRPEKKWDPHEVRKYLDAAFGIARRELTGSREQVGASDATVGIIVETLLRGTAGRLFVLDHWFGREVTEQIIQAVTALSPEDRNRVCETLLGDYVSNRRAPQIHRANAVYFVSRLHQGDDAYGRELTHAAPSTSLPLLYRTFHVGLGFLGLPDVADDYSLQLWQGRGRHWERQREENLRFHDFYYGSRENTLARLREKLAVPSSQNVLSVVTLGMTAASQQDLDILDQEKDLLLTRGIEPALLRHVEDAIWQRARAAGQRTRSSTGGGIRARSADPGAGGHPRAA